MIDNESNIVIEDNPIRIVITNPDPNLLVNAEVSNTVVKAPSTWTIRRVYYEDILECM